MAIMPTQKIVIPPNSQIETIREAQPWSITPKKIRLIIRSRAATPEMRIRIDPR
jgi:hypothetical protein